MRVCPRFVFMRTPALPYTHSVPLVKISSHIKYKSLRGGDHTYNRMVKYEHIQLTLTHLWISSAVSKSPIYVCCFLLITYGSNDDQNSTFAITITTRLKKNILLMLTTTGIQKKIMHSHSLRSLLNLIWVRVFDSPSRCSNFWVSTRFRSNLNATTNFLSVLFLTPQSNHF